MDFSSSFLRLCVLVILTTIDDRACADISRLTKIAGSNIAFPLKLQNQSDVLIVAINGRNQSVPSSDCFEHSSRQLCWNNGSLALKNISTSDEGMYEVFSQNESKTFLLRVIEPPPTVHIHCLSGGKAELSCKGNLSGNVYWTLNGSKLNDSDICVKDSGRKIVLEKRVTGKLSCHRTNSSIIFSTELLCDDGTTSCSFQIGELLKDPVFFFIVAVAGGAAVLLAILASLITCCCMRSKHNFIPVPEEDEKDEGITLSAISSGPKSSPNGDHCEAAEALGDSITNPGPESLNPEAEMDPNPQVEPEAGPQMEGVAATEIESQEAMFDTADVEAVEDCFPDPIDA